MEEKSYKIRLSADTTAHVMIYSVTECATEDINRAVYDVACMVAKEVLDRSTCHLTGRYTAAELAGGIGKSGFNPIEFLTKNTGRFTPKELCIMVSATGYYDDVVFRCNVLTEDVFKLAAEFEALAGIKPKDAVTFYCEQEDGREDDLHKDIVKYSTRAKSAMLNPKVTLAAWQRSPQSPLTLVDKGDKARSFIWAAYDTAQGYGVAAKGLFEMLYFRLGSIYGIFSSPSSAPSPKGLYDAMATCPMAWRVPMENHGYDLLKQHIDHYLPRIAKWIKVGDVVAWKGKYNPLKAETATVTAIQTSYNIGRSGCMETLNYSIMVEGYRNWLSPSDVKVVRKVEPASKVCQPVPPDKPSAPATTTEPAATPLSLSDRLRAALRQRMSAAA